VFRKSFCRIGRPNKAGLANTWLSCTALCVVGLFLALVFGMRVAQMADTTLHQESFILESAEHYSNRRGKTDTHELRLKGVNGERYEIQEALISEREIEAALKILCSGEKVDIWLNEHGIAMQLSCGGQELMDAETVLRRVKYNVYGFSGLSAFMGLFGAGFGLRAASILCSGRRRRKFAKTRKR